MKKIFAIEANNVGPAREKEAKLVRSSPEPLVASLFYEGFLLHSDSIGNVRYTMGFTISRLCYVPPALLFMKFYNFCLIGQSIP